MGMDKDMDMGMDVVAHQIRLTRIYSRTRIHAYSAYTHTHRAAAAAIASGPTTTFGLGSATWSRTEWRSGTQGEERGGRALTELLLRARPRGRARWGAGEGWGAMVAYGFAM